MKTVALRIPPFLLIFLSALAGGCATAPHPQSPSQAGTVAQGQAPTTELPYSYMQREEWRGYRQMSPSQAAQTRKGAEERLNYVRLQREMAKDQAKTRAQFDQMTQEIEELEAEVRVLKEWQDNQEKKTATAAPAAPPGASNTGPRGGCYTITKSGKKNYKGC